MLFGTEKVPAVKYSPCLVTVLLATCVLVTACSKYFPPDIEHAIVQITSTETVERIQSDAETLGLSPLWKQSQKEVFRVTIKGGFGITNESLEIWIDNDGGGCVIEKVWQCTQKKLAKHAIYTLSPVEVKRLRFHAQLDVIRGLPFLDIRDKDLVVYDGVSYMLETTKESKYSVAFRSSGSSDEDLIRNLITILRNPLFIDSRNLLKEEHHQQQGRNSGAMRLPTSAQPTGV